LSGLVPINVDRLAKICGLFGSDHDGERAAAAARADRIVRDAGLTWPVVLGGESHGVVRHNRSRHRVVLTPGEILARHGAKLTGWEKRFLTSLVRRGNWSPRQREILDEIRARCGA
jgi:hypothetical protein